MRVLFEVLDLAQAPVLTLTSNTFDPHLSPLPQGEEVFLVIPSQPALSEAEWEGPLTLRFLADARGS